MKKPSRLNYAYAVGRVRVLEKYLVDRAVFSEAAEERGLTNALKVIFDAGKFTDELVQVKDSRDLDKTIEKEEKNVYRMLAEILLEEDILKIFVQDDNPAEAVSAAEKSGYTFIQDYIRHKIDLSNLKILMRAKYLGLSRDQYENLVLQSGFLDHKLILESHDLSFSEIGERLRATPYQELWSSAVDSLQNKETFLGLERGMEDFLMAFLKKAKTIVFGPEPILAYGLAKKRELKLVRLLGIGKINQIPESILKERISETYV